MCSRHGFATQMQGGFACASSSAVEAFVAGLDWYRSAFALLDAAAEPCHRVRLPRTQEGPAFDSCEPVFF